MSEKPISGQQGWWQKPVLVFTSSARTRMGLKQHFCLSACALPHVKNWLTWSKWKLIEKKSLEMIYKKNNC